MAQSLRYFLRPQLPSFGITSSPVANIPTEAEEFNARDYEALSKKMRQASPYRLDVGNQHHSFFRAPGEQLAIRAERKAPNAILAPAPPAVLAENGG